MLELRFAAFVHNMSQGCNTALSSLSAECMHPLDNHVMPGIGYTREARKIARKFAKQARHLRPDAIEVAALGASKALSEAASRHGEEYYEALHVSNRVSYEDGRRV